MPICRGEHQESDPSQSHGTNKFLGVQGEGHRGLLLGVSANAREGVVLAVTESTTEADAVHWGNLYLVRETDPEQWPRAVRRVEALPEGFEPTPPCGDKTHSPVLARSPDGKEDIVLLRRLHRVSDSGAGLAGERTVESVPDGFDILMPGGNLSQSPRNPRHGPEGKGA